MTVAERGGYRDTSLYDDVMAFLLDLDRASPLATLTTFGQSVEGPNLSLLVLADPPFSTAENTRTGGFAGANTVWNGSTGGVQNLRTLSAFLASHSSPTGAFPTSDYTLSPSFSGSVSGFLRTLDGDILPAVGARALAIAPQVLRFTQDASGEITEIRFFPPSGQFFGAFFRNQDNQIILNAVISFGSSSGFIIPPGGGSGVSSGVSWSVSLPSASDPPATPQRPARSE